MSKPTVISLFGITSSGTIAKPHEANDVQFFKSDDSKYMIFLIPTEDDTHIILRTSIGQYVLNKHSTLNIYRGVCNEHKVHVSLKKIVGKLYYW